MPSPTSTARLTKLLLLTSNLVRTAVTAPLLSSASVAVLATTAGKSHEHPPLGSEDYLLRLAFSAALVIVGGIFSGLTLGLMGLDMVNLQVLSSSGSQSEQTNARLVLGLLERGRHWVLVVLLLSNVIVNESLPLFLEPILGGGVGAVVSSTCLIVIFGEIIPQAVCARHGLSIGAYCTKFVLLLMWLEYPIAYPIAKLLDYLLGESHGTVYKKAELKTFVGLHGHIGEEMLNEDEVTIISAVLELSDKPVEAIMTPLEDVYVLASDVPLDQARVDEILALGHSRIPVHVPGEPTSFLGTLMVKRLISYDPSQAALISTFPLTVLPETAPDSTCFDALNYFQQGRSHILLVSTTPGVDGGAIGVVTLEDVIEEMIGEEIIDESDVYVDVHNKIKVVRGPQKPAVAAGKALAPLIKGVIERRRVHRQRTVDISVGTPPPPGSPVPSAPAQLAPEDEAIGRAFARMKLRGGGRPGLKKDLLSRPMSTSGLPQDLVESERDGERRPLLGRHESSPGQ